MRAVGVVLATLLVTLGASVPALAAGGGVKGTVSAAAGGHAAIADAVVMIDGPSHPASADAPHAVMAQRGDAFIPRVIVVPTGTTVDFPNDDPHLHNVYSTSKTKRFDVGMYDQGERRSVQFDAPGVVGVRCNVHPKMEATIVVHTNPWAAVTDANGSYTITGVPPGSYTLRVWHERFTERSLPVTVRDGEVTPVDARLDPRP